MTNDSYGPSLLNGVKDIHRRQSGGMATPDCYYFTSLDCLIMMMIIMNVMMIDWDYDDDEDYHENEDGVDDDDEEDLKSKTSPWSSERWYK